MGLLDFFRPSPQRLLDRARRHLAAERWADARLDALEVSGLAGADEVIRVAEHHLLRRNCEAALSWAQAGDPTRVQHHLQLAGEFRRDDQPGDADVLMDTRRQIQAIADARDAEAKARAQEEAQGLAQVDPRFKEAYAGASIPLPEGVSEEEAEALEARLAMILEALPDRHRDDAIALGAPFLQAVLQQEDGEVEAAIQAFAAIEDERPILLHQRALAAMKLGDPAAAARTWRRFAEVAGGHEQMGDLHTRIALAEALTRAGDPKAALVEVEAVRASHPKQGGMLHAALLEAVGQPAKADAVYREQLKLLGTHPQIYLAIAGLRVRSGKRVEAMSALEKSLEQSSCASGSCGPRGPDLPTLRMLATLYLEGGEDHARGLDLAAQAAQKVRQPTWDDLYLQALAQRARGEVTWHDLVPKLLEPLPEGDPRRERVQQALPA